MRLVELEVHGFRGFADETLSFDGQLTVLVGANGAGKSSLLDAIFLLLSQYSARLLGTRSAAARLKDTDVRIGRPEARLRLAASDRNTDVLWTIVKQGQRERVLRPVGSQYANLNDFVKAVADRTSAEDYLRGAVLPVYYDQTRSVLKIPQRRRGKSDNSPAAVFRSSMHVWGINFPALTYWFQDRESDELRRQKADKAYVDVELNAVRRAMTTSTSLKDPYFSVDRPRGLTFSKGNVQLHVSQLSTGEQVFLALAGDLTRRLAAVAPLGSDPLKAQGIVLIDELELHLHPRWQRTIAPWLLKTFPNCQFIVSTHSPQVLSEVSAEQVRVLEPGARGTRIHRVNSTRGRDSNHLLASVFDTSVREVGAERLIRKADQAISDGDYAEAQRLITKLASVIEGGPPEVSILQARLARRTAAE
jgi:predicted ATP-binding protein involved in virulence